MASIKKGKEPKIEKEIDRDKALLNAISGLSKDFKSINNLLKDINDNQLKGTKAYEKIHEKLVKDTFQTINKIKATGTKEILNDLKVQEQKIKNEMKQLDLEKKKEDKIDRELRKKQNAELFKKRLERYNEEIKSIQEEREKLKKEKSKNRYKENTLYKVGSNIKGQPSSVVSSIGLSVATGGLINPVIAKTLGLDKIVTASVKLAGRTIGNVSSKIYDATVGSIFKNIMDPFKNKKSYVRKNIDKGSDVVKNAFGGSWFGAFNKKEGAIAKNEEENNPIVKEQKKTNNILELLKKHVLGKEEKEKKKEGGSILGKLLQAIGGFGTILKGAAIAAIPYVIKTFFPKIAKWLDDKFKAYLTGTIGLSEGGAEVVSQLVKDALPGALFGFKVKGIRGAIIGGLLSLAAINLYRLSEKIGEWTATAVNWLKEHPATAIGGSLLGIANLGNIKKAASALSTYMHKAVDSSKNLGSALSNFAKKLGTVTFGFLKTNISKLASAMSAGAAKITSGISKYIISYLPAIRTAMSGLVKAIGWLGAAFMAYDIGKMIGEWVGKKMNEKEEKERKKTNKKVKSIKDMSKEELSAYNQWLHDTGQWEGYAQGYTIEKGLILDSKKDFDYDRSLEQFHNYQEKILNNGPEYDVPDFKQLGFENLKQYSDVPWNSSIKRNRGIPKRIADNLNSIHDNVISPLQMALGTHKITITSSYRDSKYNEDIGGAKGSKHLTGNAVDLQVSGMTPEQVSNVLRKANIPFARAIREKSGNTQWLHLEYNPNGNNPGILANLNATTGKYVQVSPGKIGNANDIKLSTSDMPTTAENQYVAMNTMNEMTQATAEAQETSNGGIMDLLGNISNGVATTAENTTSSINNMFSGLSISNAGSQNQGQSLSFSIPNTNGGAGSSTGSVYQFGDVAKTPILYTL